jgi:hypothetical protein
LLGALGTLLLAAAVAALLARAAGWADTAGVATLLGLGTAAGLALGALRALRRPAPSVADAAWALDRRARAEGRGLVAAVVPGAVGAEAAWASPPIAPPAVRLKPASGLALAAGAALLGAIALFVPTRSRSPTPLSAAGEAADEVAVGAAGDAAAADAAAERALATERVREALGLSRESAADPALVAERLADPNARRAAEEAAAGTGLESLVGTTEGEAHDLSQALAGGARSEEEARRLRREAATARAVGGVASVPLARRGVVERWFAGLAPEERTR